MGSRDEPAWPDAAPMQPVTLDTLQSIQGKHAIAAYCVTCRRHAWVDLARVADTSGWKLSLERLKRRLTCARCGRRGVEMRLIYRPADAPGGYPCAVSPRAAYPPHQPKIDMSGSPTNAPIRLDLPIAAEADEARTAAVSMLNHQIKLDNPAHSGPGEGNPIKNK